MKAKNDWESPRDPWIGVDMDATLARHDGPVLPWNVFGPPIPRMLQRVKEWVSERQKVVIVTARVFPYILGHPCACYDASPQTCLVTGQKFTVEEMVQVIADWTFEHVGTPLPATCAKDYRMLQLWDDRAIQVIANTGMTLAEENVAKAAAQRGKAQG